MAYNELIGTLGEQSAAWYKEECRQYAEQAQQSATNAENSATSAERDAGIASDKADIATNKANLAGESADLAQEWAIKTDGKVGGIDFSSKQYAINAGESATTAGNKADEASASATLAEKWASYTNGTVDGTNYSAKQYALNAGNSATTASTKAGEASDSAQTASDKAGIATTQAGLASGSALSASNSATLAENWATKTDGTVDGTNYSAKKYAENAQTSATNAGTSETNAGNSATLAEKWATKMGGTVDGNEYSAKYYANEASNSASSANDSASSAQSNADYIQTEAVKIDTTEKRVSNIEKLLEGNLYDYQTDTDTKYTKTVPAGAMPYASLDSIGGKTVVWNQLQANTSSRTLNGVVFTFDSTHGSLTISEETPGATRTSTAYWLGGNDIKWNWITGHKYLVRLGANPIANGRWYIPNVGGATIVNINTKDAIVDVASRTMYLQVQVLPTDDISTPITYYPQVHDLTLMYGSGNEPSTVAEFQQTFPAVWYAFNNGTLLSAGVTDVKSVGKNLWNEQWEVGKYNTSDGTKATDNATIRSANQIDVLPSTQYYVLIPHTSVISGFAVILYYDINGNFIGSVNARSKGEFITTPNNAYHMAFFVSSLYGTTYKNDICINLSNASVNGNYYPYNAHTYPIPASIQALEGYGWSAGSVYNYVDYERKVFVQRVGSKTISSADVNLSTYIYTNITYAAIQKPTDFAGRGNSNVYGLVSDKYVVSNATTNWDDASKVNQIFYRSLNNVIWFGMPYGTTLATAQSELDGTTIYYELATPIETDISAYITDDNLISVESGGTLTFENQNGDDYRMDVPSAETYMIDLQASL